MFKHIIYTIKSEFKAVFTDGGALLLLLFATMIYTTIYSVAYGSEVVRDIPIVVVDEDRTSASRRLIDGVDDGPDTMVAYEANSMSEALNLFYCGDVFAVFNIPSGYEADILADRQADVALILDGSHLLLYSHVLQQALSDVITSGAMIEAGRIISKGGSDVVARSVVEPVQMNVEMLYNPYMGYGTFVMPSILMVIIQQTMIIGIAMVALHKARRREGNTLLYIVASTMSKILVYMLIYSLILLAVLGIIWPLFDLPYFANSVDLVLLLLIYLIATAALGLTLAHLFKRREAPLMLLLWASVPILLLAGLSYPHEAFPEWLYSVGRILPSSSGVDAFIQVVSTGASLDDILPDIYTLLTLAFVYLSCAIMCEYRSVNMKKIV